MEIIRDYSRNYVMSDRIFEAERQRDKEKKKNFKFVKSYTEYDLYEHKKYGFKECFYKYNVS